MTLSPRRRVPAVLLFTALPLALSCLALMPAGQARAAAAAEPSVVRQLITVTAPAYGSTYATLRVYLVAGPRRTEVFGPWTARVGYRGVARPGKKREGDGTTPAGRYGLSFFFGVQPNLGFHFPFRHAYTYDYWDDDPASPRYNEWVNARVRNPGARPEPMHQVPAYDYAAVIAYNTARVPGLGSAIFLHVGTNGPTAGCVSLPRAELIRLLRWLRPSYSPVISITVG